MCVWFTEIDLLLFQSPVHIIIFITLYSTSCVVMCNHHRQYCCINALFYYLRALTCWILSIYILFISYSTLLFYHHHFILTITHFIVDGDFKIENDDGYGRRWRSVINIHKAKHLKPL